MAFATRFAPSPTGPLHLGHAYSALLAHDMARAEGGHFFLRIEDIDRARSRRAWEAQILDDLAWLGISWDAPPMRQSDRMPFYSAALESLWQRDLLYPCTCTRRDIEDAMSAPNEGARTQGPDGPVYPGTCRVAYCGGLPCSSRPRPTDRHLRLDIDFACSHLDQGTDRDSSRSGGLAFLETGEAHRGEVYTSREQFTAQIGDVVVARKDFGTSYHLSVVVDDAAQAVTHVVRGEDLFEATRIHVLLQHLLGLPTPVYRHHRLIRDDQNRRLAKRDDARALANYRADGATPDDIRRMVGLA